MGELGCLFFPSFTALGSEFVELVFCCWRQYFQARLNTTEWRNGTAVVGKNYYFNNWMTLLSQLPLLLFTLLNSILYQRSEVVRHPDAPPGYPPHPNCSFSASRISEAIRIAGSLIFILLLFIFTAVLVKVPLEADRFFSITMATIWFINCECASPCRPAPRPSWL